MERTLRRLAWKDEDFREALLADPKGIIQQMFPHCFPDGKLPDDLTITVVEQDPFTRHIVLPAFVDEEPTLEIPEEDQLDLIVNMGDAGNFRESPEAKNLAQNKATDWSKQQFKAKEMGQQQERTVPKKTINQIPLGSLNARHGGV